MGAACFPASGYKGHPVIDGKSQEDLYASWNPAELFMRQGRERVAIRLLKGLDVFPVPGLPCLEIGYGRLGWLATLLGWGLRTEDLYGIELEAERARVAGAAFPGATLEIGSAVELPWGSEIFQLVVASTVFTSILDPDERKSVAREMIRVLRPSGAVLFYDFRVNSPANPKVRKVSRGELHHLFPGMHGVIRSVTLAPPVTRGVVSWSWALATVLESVPFLRTHLLAILVKQ